MAGATYFDRVKFPLLRFLVRSRAVYSDSGHRLLRFWGGQRAVSGAGCHSFGAPLPPILSIFPRHRGSFFIVFHKENWYLWGRMVHLHCGNGIPGGSAHGSRAFFIGIPSTQILRTRYSDFMSIRGGIFSLFDWWAWYFATSALHT